MKEKEIKSYQEIIAVMEKQNKRGTLSDQRLAEYKEDLLTLIIIGGLEDYRKTREKMEVDIGSFIKALLS